MAGNMVQILSLLNTQMEKPGLFGLFHILSLVVMVGIIVGLFFLFKKNQEKTAKCRSPYFFNYLYCFLKF